MAITYLSFRYFYCVNAYKLWTIYYIKIVYLSGVGPVRYIIKDNQYFVCMIPGLVLSSITNQPLIFCESNTRRCYFVALIVVNDFNSRVLFLPYCNTWIRCSKVYSDSKSFIFPCHDYVVGGFSFCFLLGRVFSWFLVGRCFSWFLVGWCFSCFLVGRFCSRFPLTTELATLSSKQNKNYSETLYIEPYIVSCC